MGKRMAQNATNRTTNEPEIQRVFQSKAETKAFYDKISHVYDLLAEHSEGPIRRAGLEKLSARPGEKVLEIGFGTGHSLVSLAQSVGPTGKVYGVDLSERMLDVAKDNLHKAGLADRVELTCGDAVQLAYPTDSLDAIFMSFTLELFDTPEIPKVLDECKRVLRRRGRIVVVAVSKEGEGGIILHVYEWSHRHFPNLVDCRPIFVRQSMESAGSLIESAERQMMWVPVEVVLAPNLDCWSNGPLRHGSKSIIFPPWPHNRLAPARLGSGSSASNSTGRAGAIWLPSRRWQRSASC